MSDPISAVSESEVRQLAEKDGILVEEIIELPPEPATVRQLKYAKDLGISIPANATKGDLSDLISLKLEKDKPSTKRHREFARKYGIETTQYIGKKTLFDRIRAALIVPGRENELLSWFTYRVYRELANGADNAPIQGPNDPVIQEISERLSSDEKIIKSIRRYQGRNLIWFGEWTSPDGYVHTGGSNRTVAYKTVASLLTEKARFPAKLEKNLRSTMSSGTQNRKSARKPKGCLSIIVFTLLVSVGIAVSFVLFG